MNGKRLALIVASSQFDDKDLNQLIAPAEDAEELARVLGDPVIGNFEVQTLINRSRDEVGKVIEAFFQDRRRDDLLLFYYSGHGIKDENGQLYFAVPNTQRKLLRSTAISSRLLHDVMEDSRSRRQVLILDCCYSGAFTKGMRSRDDRQIGTKERFEGQGRVVLTASDNMQYAFEGEKVTGEGVQSVFTTSLLKGLETWEADLNGDGEIDLDELYDYVFAQVRDKTTKMTPRKWSDIQGEIIIARNPGRAKIAQDVKLEKRLEQLYTEGLSAFWLEDWTRAREHFQALIQLRPGYSDAAGKLAEAERQLLLAAQYAQALAKIQAEDWRGALEPLEAIIQQTPAYKDAAARLAEVRKRVQLDDLYAEATRLHQAGQWQAVVKVFDRMKTISPDVPDPQGLLQKAKSSLAQQENEARLQTLYRDALQAMNTSQWEEARRLFRLVQAIEPEYRETRQLRARVEAEIARQRRKQSPDKTPQTNRLQKIPLWGWVTGGVGLLIFLCLVGVGVMNQLGWLGNATPITPLPVQTADAKAVPMALIPAGTFQMGSENGSDDERPVHTVSLDDFFMDVYEVTN
ncbi:MAG TPA: caspase family protein, partial [Anaerolineales bacterium]|nr:caspase family protein [Anaerolineales bacterium]